MATDWRALENMAREIPVDLLYSPNLESYGVFNANAEGSWTPILSGNTLVGVVWTDWNESSGYVSYGSVEYVDTILSYFDICKKSGVDAGVAYSTFATYVQNHMEDLSLGDQDNGILMEVFELENESSEDEPE